ncbi:hypothetical protein A2T76_24615 [Pseudomonas brenneri]|nr:hypothetical protein A2T76_24615 [Pseudomonas brenneri]
MIDKIFKAVEIVVDPFEQYCVATYVDAPTGEAVECPDDVRLQLAGVVDCNVQRHPCGAQRIGIIDVVITGHAFDKCFINVLWLKQSMPGCDTNVIEMGNARQVFQQREQLLWFYQRVATSD